jgi:hypothetical protein
MSHTVARPILCALAGGLLLAACRATTVTPPAPEPEPARARAALATLHVDNATAVRLLVLYRFANRSAPDVGVGHVEPGTLTELAPVPAGEPLILIARTPSATELRLGPRTFEIDGSWTWQIPRGARFVRPSGAP